jgi:hypothetical protein
MKPLPLEPATVQVRDILVLGIPGEEDILMTAHRNRQMILATGLWFGLAAGVVSSLNTLTSAALVGELGEQVISYMALLVVAALACGSGLNAARISKRAATGLWIGLLVAVIASVMANALRVGQGIAFYDAVRHDPGELRDWLHRGGGPFVDYLIADRIGGFIDTTLFFGYVCGVLGLVGGWIGKARTIWPVS